MKSLFTRIALAVVVAASASLGAAAAYYPGTQSAAVMNPVTYPYYYPGGTYVGVFKQGSYGTAIKWTTTQYGNYSYSVFHPYTLTNYEHWLYNLRKQGWDYVYTVRFTDK